MAYSWSRTGSARSRRRVLGRSVTARCLGCNALVHGILDRALSDAADLVEAHLAVDQSRQGQGLGRDLLIEAIGRAATAGQHAAARFICVDPISDSARSFYASFGFREVAGDDGGRMYLRIDEALKALGIQPG